MKMGDGDPGLEEPEPRGRVPGLGEPRRGGIISFRDRNPAPSRCTVTLAPLLVPAL